MDNIGDWLYIVFLVIAGISGLFSSKEKKRRERGSADTATQPIPGGQPLPGDSAGELGDKPFQEPSRPDPAPRKRPSKPRVKSAPPPPLRPAPFLATERTTHATPKPQPTVEPVLAEEAEDLPTAHPLKEIDELKKAVIYAEILNRKY